MGVPVISSDVGGQRDLVDDTTGALVPCLQEEQKDLDSRVFPEEEINRFADAIVSLLTDQQAWEKASRNCRRKIEEGFTIRNMVERLEAEINLLTEDPVLAEKRRTVSQSLQNLNPLAEELYVGGLGFQRAEDMAAHGSWESLRQKILRVLRSEGIFGLTKKVISKIKRKLVK